MFEIGELYIYVEGRLHELTQLIVGKNSISLSAKAGIYIAKIKFNDYETKQKIIIR